MQFQRLISLLTPGGSIQSAVDHASNSDTILINSNNGTDYTYQENVVISKTLTLKSTAGVTVQALNSSQPVFTVKNSGSGSNINGFNITGATNSSGIYLDSVTDCVIKDNNIKNNTYGIYSTESLNNTIQNNNINDNNIGIFIEDHNYSPNNPNNILYNVITGNNQGIHLNTTTVNINFNQITNTIGLYINSAYVNEDRWVFINSDNNWWGTNNPECKNLCDFNGTSAIHYNDYIDGPYYIEEISRLCEPWLVLNTTNSSTVTADLTHNSNGEDTSSQGHIPDNIPINFTANLGTITTPVYIRNGKATATFNRGTVTTGVANITTILDNQTVQTNITINTTTPTVTATPTGGTYNTMQSVTLTATDNLDPNPIIYYTMDGSTPTTSSRRYTDPISVNSSVLLSFVAVDSKGNMGVIQTLNYIIVPIVNVNTGRRYSHIQDAINDSSTLNGHIIEVNTGTYTENVVVNKSLTLQSVQGNVTIQALNPSCPVFTINSGGSGSVISGFTITRSDYGVYLDSTSDCSIIGNVINGNDIGIYVQGSNNNEIEANEIVNNGMAISLNNSTCNTISDNHVSVVIEGPGINFNNSSNNTFTGNNIEDALYISHNSINNIITGNYIDYISISDSDNTVIYENNINIIYVDNSDAEIHFNRIVGGIYGLENDSGTINATNNWWGTNNVSYVNSINPPSTCNIWNKNGTVNYNPWLILNTSTTNSGENTSVNADLTHNNTGDDTSSQGHIPDNIPIYFQTNLGTIVSPAYTRNGKATATFNRGTNTSGVATITTTLDNQTVQNSITIDTTPPTVTSNLSGGVYNTTKSVTLTATDNLDLNPVIYYSVNNGATWNNRVKTVTLSLNQGITNLKYYTTDAAGNNSITQIVNYTIDTTPPTVTINLPSGIYNTIKSVTLTATDNLDSNPVIYYSVDNGVTWNSQIKTITLNLPQGVTSLKYYTGDMAGNIGPIQTVNYTIDTIPPVVSSTDPDYDIWGVPADKVIKITFSEPVQAGSNWIELKNSAGTVIPITTSINDKVLTVTPNSLLIHETEYTLTVHTGSLTDIAGNNISLYSTCFTVDSTPPTVNTSLPGGSYHTPQSVTLTASDDVDPAPVIYYTTNGTTPTLSSTKYTVPIAITNTTTLSFMAVDNAGNIGETQVVTYTIDTRPYCVYSFQIPRYCNVTLPFVGSENISPEYVVKSGVNGIVKVGVSRFIRIDTPNGHYYFNTGNIAGTSSTRLYNGYSNNLPGNVSISCNYNYVTISYYGDVSNSLNQFSVIYRDGDDPEYETVDILLNGVKKASISFSMTLPPYDDAAIRYQLFNTYYHTDTGIWPPPEDFLFWDYGQLCHNHPIPTMKFTNTGENIVYNVNLDHIMNSPSLEYINTQMSIGNTTINKQEKVTYGTNYAPSSSQDAGFEAIQSYAITRTKITDATMQYWLNQKNRKDAKGNLIYSTGEMKAAYGTFMTALTTIWLSDKLADEMAAKTNVTWNRNTTTAVMAGINNNGTAYVHTPDAGMGMGVTGGVGDVKFFRLVCSLLLSEVENASLGGTGLSVNSTFSTFMSAIRAGNHFKMSSDNKTVKITLEGDPSFRIIIDYETGVVKEITDINGFSCKGVWSTESAYCYHDQLSNHLPEFISDVKQDARNLFNQLGVGWIGDHYGEIKNGVELFVNGACIIVTKLSIIASISWMFEMGNGAIYFRDNYLPSDFWLKVSYHDIWNKDVYWYVDPNDNQMHYTEVPKS